MTELLSFRTKDEKRKAEIFERANRELFERECAAEGIDSARGISPSLLKSIGMKREDA